MNQSISDTQGTNNETQKLLMNNNQNESILFENGSSRNVELKSSTKRIFLQKINPCHWSPWTKIIAVCVLLSSIAFSLTFIPALGIALPAAMMTACAYGSGGGVVLGLLVHFAHLGNARFCKKGDAQRPFKGEDFNTKKFALFGVSLLLGIAITFIPLLTTVPAALILTLTFALALLTVGALAYNAAQLMDVGSFKKLHWALAIVILLVGIPLTLLTVAQVVGVLAFSVSIVAVLAAGMAAATMFSTELALILVNLLAFGLAKLALLGGVTAAKKYAAKAVLQSNT